MRRPSSPATRRRRGRAAARRGGRRAAKCTIPEGSPHLRALQTIDDVLVETGRCDGLRAVETAGDIDAAIAAGEVALILHLEGLKPILGAGNSRASALLRHFHRLGLRSAQLTWNGGNDLADGVGVERPGGLTPLGRDMVAELERLGIMIDVSHLSEPSFWDLLEVASGPVVATHANAFALCPHRRNLRDEQILRRREQRWLRRRLLRCRVHRRGADDRTAARPRRPPRGARRGGGRRRRPRTMSSSRST